MSKICEDCGCVNDTPEYDTCSECYEDKQYDRSSQVLYITDEVEKLALELMELTGEPAEKEMNHILVVELNKRIRRHKLQENCDHPEHRIHEHKGEEWCTQCNKYLGYKK